jgi:hypothetical protein
MGYIAVIAVAAAAYWEYRTGFKEARGTSIFSVGFYFVVNVALYFWDHFIQQNIVYVGRKADLTVYPSYAAYAD